MDVLAFNKKKWYAYEVKSSLDVKEDHIWDAALQYYVITNSGIKLDDIYIIHVNRDYRRNGSLNHDELFIKESVKKQVLEIQDEIKQKVAELKIIALQKKEPKIDIGLQCPCEFENYCWAHMPDDHVFELRGHSARTRAVDLYQQGILKIEDIPADFKLNKGQEIQVNTQKTKKKIILKNEIQQFLGGIEYPIYYMDFETINPAVPDYDGCSPYEKIPFQYSLHIEQAKGNLQHHEYLGNPQSDPRKDFIELLLSQLGTTGTILAYSKSFEISVLKKLAAIYPDLSDDIYAAIDRVEDLIVPFRSKHYYTHLMKGSYSIKKVLPALVPSLNYESMAITNGGDASDIYYQLRYVSSEVKVKEIRNNLLEYCKLDTFGMVKIMEVLRKV